MARGVSKPSALLACENAQVQTARPKQPVATNPFMSAHRVWSRSVYDRSCKSQRYVLEVLSRKAMSTIMWMPGMEIEKMTSDHDSAGLEGQAEWRSGPGMPKFKCPCKISMAFSISDMASAPPSGAPRRSCKTFQGTLVGKVTAV